MKKTIYPISYYLPNNILDNNELAAIFKEWNAQKIYKKTGIFKRHIASKDEFVSDMAIQAGKKLLEEYCIEKEEVEFLIVVTQSPDYLLPSISCIVQDKLGLSKKTGAFDINLGCSGFTYALSVAKAFIQSNIVKNTLIICAETYSKWINKMDKSTRTLFGDAAVAIFLNKENVNFIGEFIFGTDGSGYNKLIVPNSGLKYRNLIGKSLEKQDINGYIRSDDNLYMDGAGIFEFSIETTPKLVKDVLIKNNCRMEDIDLFIFHQANKFIIKNLGEILNIPKEKLYIDMQDIGNTVSCSIPIALKNAWENGYIKIGYKVLIVGFGVGLSYSGTILKF